MGSQSVRFIVRDWISLTFFFCHFWFVFFMSYFLPLSEWTIFVSWSYSVDSFCLLIKPPLGCLVPSRVQLISNLRFLFVCFFTHNCGISFSLLQLLVCFFIPFQFLVLLFVLRMQRWPCSSVCLLMCPKVTKEANFGLEGSIAVWTGNSSRYGCGYWLCFPLLSFELSISNALCFIQ